MADYDLDSEMAGDLTRDNDPVGHDDLNLVLDFWNERPDDRLLALNAVLEHWGNVYASDNESFDESADESADESPRPFLSCNLPEEATDLLKRHENDTFSAAAQQFPQLRQTETMVDSERTVLILHEKLVDAERVLDVCFYSSRGGLCARASARSCRRFSTFMAASAAAAARCRSSYDRREASNSAA